VILAVALCLPAGAAENTAADRFLHASQEYADTMVERGRDRWGLWHSPLFASVLDRGTLDLLTYRPPSPGAREHDRAGRSYKYLENGAPPPMTGANVFHDEDFYRMLYSLSEVTGAREYAQAADDALRYFLTHAQHPDTGLLAWGEHMCWDLELDRSCSQSDRYGQTAFDPVGDVLHEYGRDWVLWERCYDLAPEACLRFAHGVWNHQIADQETGNFSRHARWSYHGVYANSDYPRHAGFFIRTWADLYGESGDERLLHPIDVLLSRYERKREEDNGMLRFDDTEGGRRWAMTSLNLSLAVDCWAAAQKVPEPLASRLRAFAETEDDWYLSLPHFATLRWNERSEPAPAGLVTCIRTSTGKPYEIVSQAYTGRTGAAMDNAAVQARYAQTKDPRFLELLVRAADEAMDWTADADGAYPPVLLASILSTYVTVYEATGEQKYLDKAVELGDMALELFFADNPLPPARSDMDHYESVTGAGTLGLALLDLHVALNDLPVDVPGNTLNR
jgi:hypothetical protein